MKPNAEKQEWHKKADAELLAELVARRDRLWNLGNDLAAGKVKNVREIQTQKKSIARILTVLSLRRAMSSNQSQ